MRLPLILVGVGIAALPVGCKSNRGAPEPSSVAQAAGSLQDGRPEAEAAEAAVDAAPPPLNAEPVPADRRMANCPSAVAGSSTAVSVEGDVVVLSVTAADAAAIEEIRTRAERLAATPVVDGGEVSHDGNGLGGGLVGRCPVVRAGASLAVQPMEGGARLVLTPTGDVTAETLRAEAAARAAALSSAP